jgi:hypothetical protein
MQHFVSYRFIASNFDPFILTHKTEAFFIAIYVDNIILYSLGGPMIKYNTNIPKSLVKVIDLGDLH